MEKKNEPIKDDIKPVLYLMQGISAYALLGFANKSSTFLVVKKRICQKDYWL